MQLGLDRGRQFTHQPVVLQCQDVFVFQNLVFSEPGKMINELDHFNLDCIAQYFLGFVVDRKKAFHLY